jgi:hypothetical protein
VSLCQCGCGDAAKGQNRFLHGHAVRIRPRSHRRISAGYAELWIDGRYWKEHVVVATKALGKPLPAGAQVHHIDGNKLNNTPANLVVCQDGAYHNLLHRRQRALKATGNPNSRLCHYCHKWDAPENIYVSGEHARHPACISDYHRTRRMAAK